MKQAKEQAERIAADKRAEAVVENLKAATDIINNNSKDYATKVKIGEESISNIVENADSKHKQQLADLQIKAMALLAKVKAGENVNEVVRELNLLRAK